eukprot:CAMPEP_0119199698 /NCGR_PEP_ID=MMETSP1316-20130426/23577_1 /TAXON_ID=41880 /ORGANISM="Pycnococcus provasolii, Strain RCC2336" /LENGTH=92 /DNA_ID=CAMNT_0007195713 /DNA_START=323 /DNA_END=601 /DNA_ORIENTATION=+
MRRCFMMRSIGTTVYRLLKKAFRKSCSELASISFSDCAKKRAINFRYVSSRGTYTNIPALNPALASWLERGVTPIRGSPVPTLAGESRDCGA